MSRFFQFLIPVMLLTFDGLVSLAQNSKVVSTFNYITYYTRDNDKDALLKAKGLIDEAAAHETTSGQAKTWYYRGMVYQYLALDDKHGSGHPDALNEAWKSYKKVIEIDDKKFRDQDQAINNSIMLANLLHNNGVDNFGKADYKKAYANFQSILDIKTTLAGIGKGKDIDEQAAMLNAALAADRLNDVPAAKAMYEKLIASDYDNPAVYQELARINKTEGNEAKTLEILQAGIKRYPNNISLIIDELNIYLANNQQEKALEKLQDAIKLDPQNADLYYALAYAYETSKDIENAKANYEKAIEIRPDYFDAYNNLGAIYYNQAIALNTQMNELGFSKADQEKYKKLEGERNALYDKSLPYFEKAHQVDPEHTGMMNALKEIYAKKGDYEKSNVMKKKLDALGQ